jgi:hypothetical protein
VDTRQIQIEQDHVRLKTFRFGEQRHAVSQSSDHIALQRYESLEGSDHRPVIIRNQNAKAWGIRHGR